MKSDIENFKYLFQIEDGGGIEGTCISVQLITSLPSFWINLLNTRDRKGPLICIVDGGWSKSSLTSLERVLLCLDRVGVI